MCTSSTVPTGSGFPPASGWFPPPPGRAPWSSTSLSSAFKNAEAEAQLGLPRVFGCSLGLAIHSLNGLYHVAFAMPPLGRSKAQLSQNEVQETLIYPLPVLAATLWGSTATAAAGAVGGAGGSRATWGAGLRVAVLNSGLAGGAAGSLAFHPDSWSSGC